MITLITGLPGAGKTLYTVYLINQKAKKEGRQVYYHGIKGLTLDWIALEKPDDWYQCPDGSIIVLDEAQQLFRQRSVGAAVPPYVAALETHRHHGHDLIIITQHPMLLDNAIRRLTEQHIHVMRPFGLERSVIHEFPQICDKPEKSRKGSITKHFKYPKEVFEMYKSAEIHTHKKRIPLRAIAIFFIPLLVAVCGYFAYQVFNEKSDSKRILDATNTKIDTTIKTSTYKEIDKSEITTDEYLRMRKPRIEGLPHTAPLYDEVMTVKAAPQPKACVSSADRCQCYTDQGTRIDTPENLCRNLVKTGYFDVTAEARSSRLTMDKSH